MSTMFLFCSRQHPINGGIECWIRRIRRRRARRKNRGRERSFPLSKSTTRASRLTGSSFGAHRSVTCAPASATLLRFAFEHDERDRSPLNRACRRLEKSIAAEGAAKARRLGLEIPLGEFDDPQLRRLAIATALLKAGFDPGQARDDHGRWTDEGDRSESGSDGEVGRGSSVAGAGYMSPPGVEADAAGAEGASAAEAAAAASASRWAIWTGRLWSGLAAIGEAAAAPVLLAGGLCLIPLNRGLVSEGTLPDHADLSYRFALDETASLTLHRTDENGDRQTIFTGYRDSDGNYRNEQGEVVARYADSALVIDPAAASALPLRWFNVGQPDALAYPGTAVNDNAEINAGVSPRNQPIGCPDPSSEETKGRTQETMDYEHQVTGTPAGIVFRLNGVDFDGCRPTDGTMLEAKGEGYDEFLDANGQWQEWFLKSKNGWPKMAGQLQAQSAAAFASGRLVEWHVAEPRVANYIADFVRAYRIPNVKAIYDPVRK